MYRLGGYQTGKTFRIDRGQVDRRTGPRRRLPGLHFRIPAQAAPGGIPIEEDWLAGTTGHFPAPGMKLWSDHIPVYPFQVAFPVPGGLAGFSGLSTR